MGYKDKTYIIFDGDKDYWAYARMKGWKALRHIDFDFENAHDEYPMTDRASDETYVKGKLRKRFATAKQVVVLIGESTKNLYRYVRWELEVAQELNLPIIAVNLNGLRQQDITRCPPIIRDKFVVHVCFRMKIIQYAMDNFPSQYHREKYTPVFGGLSYRESVYQSLGLND